MTTLPRGLCGPAGRDRLLSRVRRAGTGFQGEGRSLSHPIDERLVTAAEAAALERGVGGRVLAPWRLLRVWSRRTSAPLGESAPERVRGGATATQRSIQVMAGRATGREGEETRGRGGRAGLQRPSLCASPGKDSGASAPAAWTPALSRVGHGG
jgi:hypothetical protein